jgi:hypothetical protein
MSKQPKPTENKPVEQKPATESPIRTHSIAPATGTKPPPNPAKK